MSNTIVYNGMSKDSLLAAEFEFNKEQITNGNYSTMSYWSGRIDAFKEAIEEIDLIQKQSEGLNCRFLRLEATLNCALQRLTEIGSMAIAPILEEWE
jgi:hypothetical protein